LWPKAQRALKTVIAIFTAVSFTPQSQSVPTRPVSFG
jgi:hypothetical protein